MGLNRHEEEQMMTGWTIPLIETEDVFDEEGGLI